MHPLSLPVLHRHAPVAPVLLRVTAGGVLAGHGWHQLVSVTPAEFARVTLVEAGVPAATLAAWALTLGALVGGLALVVGALTRLVAVAEVVVGAGVLLARALADQVDTVAALTILLLLVASLVAVALLGPGRPSVDHALGIEASVPRLRTRDRVRMLL